MQILNPRMMSQQKPKAMVLVGHGTRLRWIALLIRPETGPILLRLRPAEHRSFRELAKSCKCSGLITVSRIISRWVDSA